MPMRVVGLLALYHRWDHESVTNRFGYPTLCAKQLLQVTFTDLHLHFVLSCNILLSWSVLSV